MKFEKGSGAKQSGFASGAAPPTLTPSCGVCRYVKPFDSIQPSEIIDP
jgi:hypothetical protein